MFFELSSWALGLLLFAVTLGATGVGILVGRVQRELWALAGEALDSAPTASAPRLYVETLKEMIRHADGPVSGLNNRVPAVLWLEVAGAAVALGLLALYLAVLGRGVVTVLLAARARHALNSS